MSIRMTTGQVYTWLALIIANIVHPILPQSSGKTLYAVLNQSYNSLLLNERQEWLYQ